jgi:hypothetical protein
MRGRNHDLSVLETYDTINLIRRPALLNLRALMRLGRGGLAAATAVSISSWVTVILSATRREPLGVVLAIRLSYRPRLPAGKPPLRWRVATRWCLNHLR